MELFSIKLLKLGVLQVIAEKRRKEKEK